MSLKRKVIWSEGMLLEPQHFQQQDRYAEHRLESRVNGFQPFAWGFSELKIDEQLLTQGKLSLLVARGVMPDGTPFDIQDQEVPPTPLSLPEGTREALVVLALPLYTAGVAEVSEGENNAYQYNLSRYSAIDTEVKDCINGDKSTLIQVGTLRMRLTLLQQVEHTHVTLGVARIIERQINGNLLLDTEYCPPCQDYQAATRLRYWMEELSGLLNQRAYALAQRIVQPTSNGVGEVADFLMLQLLNRYCALFNHCSKISGIHPENIYRYIIQLAAELETFGTDGKLFKNYQTYRHTGLFETFFPAIQDIRRSLSNVMDPLAYSIPLEERQYGISVALINDVNLFDACDFILEVTASYSAEILKNIFPGKIKLGSIETIRDLVNLQLPGINIIPLNLVPRQMPYHTGSVYFILDKNSSLWLQLTKSPAIALHISGEISDLKIKLWAVKRS